MKPVDFTLERGPYEGIYEGTYEGRSPSISRKRGSRPAIKIQAIGVKDIILLDPIAIIKLLFLGHFLEAISGR